MQIANTNVIAKIAAVVAGLGLVAMSFAAYAPAKAQTTTTTTTTTSATFSRDLTIGSTGADVTALQAWLIAKGFSIPAGATGYFGMQTKAALAAYQAANAIAPAVGYFGPITRAKVNAAGGTTTGTTTGGTTTTGSTTLSGGEADLNDFNLIGEDTSGDEGESEVQLATAEFDVDSGDVNVQRIEVTFDPTNNTSGVEQRPSKYFDNISVWANGKKLADMDTDNRDDWDENGSGNSTTYTVSLTGLNYVVREGDQASITIAADINDSIDTDDLAQDFDITVEDDAVRAIDAAGVQQYIGDGSDSVSFGFGAQQSGDLTVRESSDNPDADTLIIDDQDESDDFTVLGFEIDNNDDADALLTDLTVTVATSTSATATSTSDIIRSATLTIGGDDFRGDINDDNTIDFDSIDATISGNDVTDGSLSVTFNGSDVIGASQTVSFAITAANVTAEGDASGDNSDVSGTAQGETFSLVSQGIAVINGQTTSDSRVINTTTGGEQGDFEVTFDVEAVDETVYIAKSADNATTTVTAGVLYNVVQGTTATSTVVGTTDIVTANDSDNGDTSTHFIVREGDTRSFTLHVSIDPVQSDFYSVELEAIRFDTNGTTSFGNDTTYSVPDISEFETDAEQLNG
ncbi:MAG: Penicillin-resistant dd-carboxypeptidase-like protein [Parcubacteria group bacterium]|nr:Penicillin-resistant dd-carboxypeptidase-like protein [Parcubacteria group bacterium]